MEKAIEYAKTIESWEDLVDPRTLAFYCLGLDLSPYVHRLIDIEGKRVSPGFVSTATFSVCLLKKNFLTSVSFL